MSETTGSHGSVTILPVPSGHRADVIVAAGCERAGGVLENTYILYRLRASRGSVGSRLYVLSAFPPSFSLLSVLSSPAKAKAACAPLPQRLRVHSGGTPRSHTAPALPGGTLFVPSTLENAVPVLSLLTCVAACFSAAWDSSRTGMELGHSIRTSAWAICSVL